MADLERRHRAGGSRGPREGIGLIVWLSTVPFDNWVTRFMGQGHWPTFLVLRAIGALIVLSMLGRLRRPPEPSTRASW